MKLLNRKNASIVIMTTLLGMPLTQVMAEMTEQESTVPGLATDQAEQANQAQKANGEGPVSGYANKQVPNDDQQDQDAADDDDSINDRVKSAFSNNNDLRDLDIDVKTDNGEVSLSGEVSSQEQRNMAINKAKEIQGVKNVDADDLEVDN